MPCDPIKPTQKVTLYKMYCLETTNGKAYKAKEIRR